MENETPVFVSLECSVFMRLFIDVSSNTSSFHVYTLELLSELVTMEQNEHVVCSWYGRRA